MFSFEFWRDYFRRFAISFRRFEFFSETIWMEIRKFRISNKKLHFSDFEWKLEFFEHQGNFELYLNSTNYYFQFGMERKGLILSSYTTCGRIPSQNRQSICITRMTLFGRAQCILKSLICSVYFHTDKSKSNSHRGKLSFWVFSGIHFRSELLYAVKVRFGLLRWRNENSLKVKGISGNLKKFWDFFYFLGKQSNFVSDTASKREVASVFFLARMRRERIRPNGKTTLTTDVIAVCARCSRDSIDWCLSARIVYDKCTSTYRQGEGTDTNRS